MNRIETNEIELSYEDEGDVSRLSSCMVPFRTLAIGTNTVG